MSEPYGLGTAPPARRALAEKLPPDVAAAAAEFITGPLCANPRRVGKALGEELSGIYSARVAGSWRVLYEIDELQRVVIVLDIRHRSVAYQHWGRTAGAAILPQCVCRGEPTGLPAGPAP